MAKLILIKHAAPQVDPMVESSKWPLSDRGRAMCKPLAMRIAEHEPAAIVSSTEPKALETAQLVAAELGLSSSTAEGLHEHDRSNVPHMRSGEFISMVELFFRKPEQRVLGNETAAAAASRFAGAIDGVLTAHPEENLAVVTHGTVLALLLADRAGQNAFELWRSMALPSFVVIERPDWRVIEVVNRIG